MIGKLSLNTNLVDSKNGFLNLNVTFSVFGLFSGSDPLPKSFTLEAQKFDVGEFINFVVIRKSKDKTTNPLVTPILKGVSIQSKLNANIDFSIDALDLSKSKGELRLTLPGTRILFKEEMGLPSQNFTAATIEASLQDSLLVVDKKSMLKSNDILLDFEGQVKQKSQLEKSHVDLKVAVELYNELKDQFGFVLDIVTKITTNGKVLIDIKGPVVPGPSFKFKSGS